MEGLLYYIVVGLVAMIIYRIGKFMGKIETIVSLAQAHNDVKNLALDNLGEEELTSLADDLEVERVEHGLYLAYSNGDFIAQGNDFKDLIRNVKDRFPQRIFKVVTMDAKWTDDEAQRLVDALKTQHDKKQ